MTARPEGYRVFERFDRWSARASQWLYALGVYGALPALLGLVTIDVLLRYFFSMPFQWSRDANGLLLLVTLFSALPQAWDRGHHIRMEIFYTRLHERGRIVADVLSALAAVVFFVLLAVQALRFSRYMLVTGETGEDLVAPLWPFMVFMAVCGVVFAARVIANPQATPPADQPARGLWI